MSAQEVSLLLSAVGLVALAASLLRTRRDRQHLEALRAQAREAIAKVRVTSADPRYALDASAATVERLEESGGARGVFSRVAELSVTTWVRNGFGERFLIRWHSTSMRPPYVQHLAEPRHDGRAAGT